MQYMISDPNISMLQHFGAPLCCLAIFMELTIRWSVDITVTLPFCLNFLLH